MNSHASKPFFGGMGECRHAFDRDLSGRTACLFSLSLHSLKSSDTFHCLSSFIALMLGLYSKGFIEAEGSQTSWHSFKKGLVHLNCLNSSESFIWLSFALHVFVSSCPAAFTYSRNFTKVTPSLEITELQCSIAIADPHPHTRNQKDS